jgi:hypothetical protein
MKNIDIFGRPRKSVSGLPLDKDVVLVDHAQLEEEQKERAQKAANEAAVNSEETAASSDASTHEIETTGADASAAADGGESASTATAETSQDATATDEAVEAAEEEPELTDEERREALVETIDANPALRVPCEVILDACLQQPVEEGALLDDAETQLKALDAMPVQSLSSVVEMLVRDGGLTETLTVDGELYEGTLEDAFNDETIADDAECLIYENITEAGRQTLEDIRPEHRAADLLSSQPHHRAGFIATLKACDVDGGLTTKQLEAVLDEQGLLFRNERTNLPTIYPSMYANFLKDVEAIRWDHAWITTDLGRQILSEEGANPAA